MTRVVVRDAHPNEREAVAVLTRLAYAEYETIMAPDAWRGLSGAIDAALASNERIERIVAEYDGALVGSVMLFPPSAKVYDFSDERATWPELRLLAVPPAWRGKGVGELLVGECVCRARAMGASELGLHTSHSMQSAMRLYERCGFVRAPERDFTPEGTEVIEGYRLPLG
jgi:GNAT superfamily N-acetyltransferase